MRKFDEGVQYYDLLLAYSADLTCYDLLLQHDAVTTD